MLFTCVLAGAECRVLSQRSFSEEGVAFLIRALGVEAAGLAWGWGVHRHRRQLLLLTSRFFVCSDWRPALNLAALDCADETNNAVCRDFNILGFPTVRVRGNWGGWSWGAGASGAAIPAALA